MNLLIVLFAAAAIVLLYYGFTGRRPQEVVASALRRQ